MFNVLHQFLMRVVVRKCANPAVLIETEYKVYTTQRSRLSNINKGYGLSTRGTFFLRQTYCIVCF